MRRVFPILLHCLKDEEQTVAQNATLGLEMKSLQWELQEHRVNAVKGNSRPVDPNQKGRQNATQFCICCPTIGHTPCWCNGMSTKDPSKKLSHLPKTIKETEDQAMYQNNGPEARIPREETRTRTNGGSLKNSPTAHQNFSPRPNFAYRNNHPNNGRSYDQRPIHSLNRNGGSWFRNGSFNNQSENWRNIGIFLVFPWLKGEASQKGYHSACQEMMEPTNLFSADLKTDLRLVNYLRNNKSYKKITRRQLMWFASPQPTPPLVKYQTFVR